MNTCHVFYYFHPTFLPRLASKRLLGMRILCKVTIRSGEGKGCCRKSLEPMWKMPGPRSSSIFCLWQLMASSKFRSLSIMENKTWKNNFSSADAAIYFCCCASYFTTNQAVFFGCRVEASCLSASSFVLVFPLLFHLCPIALSMLMRGQTSLSQPWLCVGISSASFSRLLG